MFVANIPSLGKDKIFSTEKLATRFAKAYTELTGVEVCVFDCKQNPVDILKMDGQSLFADVRSLYPKEVLKYILH